MVRKQTAKMGRYTNAADIYAGERLRIARLQQRITQADLGEQLGLTFQQIQKYERGTNRISIGRLAVIAEVLKLPPGYFFENGAPREDDSGIQKMLTSPDVLKLAGIMAEISDKAARQAILEVARAVARVS